MENLVGCKMHKWDGGTIPLEQRNILMKHKPVRITLVAIETFVGIWAVIGGVALVTGAIPLIQFPLTLLEGTPFNDFTIPGLALAILLGGSSLFAASTILTGRKIGVLASALAGMFTVGFEIVEIVSVNSKWGSALPIALVQQSIIFVLGLTVFGLAAYLWMAEYRGHGFLSKDSGHA